MWWTIIPRSALSFALGNTSAAVAAVIVSQALGFSHPYWAAMTVLLVAQPTRELTLQRALARFLGTLVGAGVGWLLVIGQPLHPVFLGLEIAIWVGLCAGVATWLRHVRAYSVLLAGYTAGIIALAAFSAPDQQASLALGRVGCTLVGVLASGLVALVASRQDRGALGLELRRLVVAVFQAAGDLRRSGAGLANPALGLIDEIGRLDLRIDTLSAGGSASRWRARRARRVLAKLVILIARCRSMGGAASAWAGGSALEHWAARLEAGCSLAALLAEKAEGDDAITMAGWSVLRSLHLDEQPRFRPTPRARLRLPAFDRACAAMAFARTCMAALLAALAWLVIPREQGVPLMMSTLVFVTLFSSHRNPQQAVRQVLQGSMVGVVTGFICRALLLPHADTALTAVLLAAPFLAVFTFAMARPRTAKAAIDANMSFLLTAQPGSLVVTHGGGGLLHAAAILAGVLLAAASFRWILPTDPERSAARLLARIEGELAQLEAHPLDQPGRREARIACRLVELASIGSARASVARSLDMLSRADRILRNRQSRSWPGSVAPTDLPSGPRSL